VFESGSKKTGTGWQEEEVGSEEWLTAGWAMKVDVRRRRDGTVIFDEIGGMRRGEPVATVRYRMKTVAVAIAAGVRVPRRS
jgi:hypothetical protein